ncbi:MAG: hypothetical protein E6Q78_15135 [Rhodoferax sp.]|nr:MAG: hypothetical protein E6Q78_15135 [Rhodoferax sp.]
MFSTLTIQRLSTSTIYKLWFIGLGASLVPLGVLFGLLALLGFKTVLWNGQHQFGMAGLVAGPVMGAILAVLFTAFLGSASAIGLWLYAKVRPLNIQVQNATESIAHPSQFEPVGEH